MTPSTTRLVLEACPLHTEQPEFAAHAPAQIAASMQRGADVISYTEVHTTVSDEGRRIAAQHGYVWVFHGGDTALAVSKKHAILNRGSTTVYGRNRTFVVIGFHGRKVTVFAMHWDTHGPGSQAARDGQTDSLVAAMNAASKGSGLSFFLGDCNPTAPLKHGGDPQNRLRKAGMVLIYDEAGFPADPVGVTIIGRNSRDIHVKGVADQIHPALGSDHRPVTATYEVRRVGRLRGLWHSLTGRGA